MARQARRYLTVRAIAHATLGVRRADYFAMIAAPILPVALDDSADAKQETVLAVAGFMCARELWETAESRWVQRLRKDDLAYFKSTECRSLRGEFFRFRDRANYPTKSGARQSADNVRDDLDAIICSSPLIGFAVGILLADYKDVRATEPMGSQVFPRDPYVYAFIQTMYQITGVIRRKVKGAVVQFTVDESSRAKEALKAYLWTKKERPTIGQSMGDLVHADDKAVPALQMADRLAGLSKDSFVEWVANGKRGLPKFPKKFDTNLDHISCLDRVGLVSVLKKTLKRYPPPGRYY